MKKVNSLDDLKKLREETLEKKALKAASGQKQIIVGMGTIGIASGAREVVKIILDFIEEHNLDDVIVRQAGNLGLDSFEPLVQIIIGEQNKVTYGKVTPDVMRRILKEHVLNGQIVKEYCIQQD